MNMKTFKKIILGDLRAQGLGHIAAKITRVRHRVYSGGSSVRVTATDLLRPDRDKLTSVLADYKDGYYDGMTKHYQPRTDSTGKERTAKYVFLGITFSEYLRAHTRNTLARDYGVIDDTTAQSKMGYWYDDAIMKLLWRLDVMPVENRDTA